jgi:hypothetical protein
MTDLRHAEHVYLSTACLHAQVDGRPELHDYCEGMTGVNGVKRPAQCKWCEARCTCDCHGRATASDLPGAPELAATEDQ